MSAKRKERVAIILQQIAREQHVTEEEVRTEIKNAMDAGANNPDPAVQAHWSTFQYAGKEPTVEEFILWVSEMVNRQQE